MSTGISGSNTVLSCCTIASPTARIAGGASTIASKSGAFSSSLCGVASSLIASLRRHHVAFRERRTQRVPAQRRALDAHWELPDTAEHGELAELARVGLAARVRRDEVVERAEQLLGLRDRPALHRLGHQRRRRLRDRTALALEA